MTDNQIVPSLFLFTLVAVAVIAVVGLVLFLRRRSNRHPLAGPRGRAIEEARARQTGAATRQVERPPTR